MREIQKKHMAFTTSNIIFTLPISTGANVFERTKFSREKNLFYPNFRICYNISYDTGGVTLADMTFASGTFADGGGGSYYIITVYG